MTCDACHVFQWSLRQSKKINMNHFPDHYVSEAGDLQLLGVIMRHALVRNLNENIFKRVIS